MAAPIESKYSLTKKTLKSVLVTNFASVLLTISLIYLPINGTSSLDFINNCLKATKIASIFIWLLNLIVYLIFRQELYKTSTHTKIFQWFSKGLLVYVSSILIAHVILVLFGAPMTETINETFHCAMILATAVVGPGLVHLGVNIDTWIRIFACNSPETVIERVIQFTSVSSIVGAWLGAFPIPLDWDRPWQVWPITCVLGTLLGYVGGLMSSSIFLVYQYYRLNKVKFT